MGAIRRDTYAETGYSGLYRPQFEHDNCGIGAVVSIRGENHIKQ